MRFRVPRLQYYDLSTSKITVAALIVQGLKCVINIVTAVTIIIIVV